MKYSSYECAIETIDRLQWKELSRTASDYASAKVAIAMRIAEEKEAERKAEEERQERLRIEKLRREEEERQRKEAEKIRLEKQKELEEKLF